MPGKTSNGTSTRSYMQRARNTQCFANNEAVVKGTSSFEPQKFSHDAGKYDRKEKT